MNNMNGYKIVICGGGSTYTAGIVKDLLDQKDELGIRELWLYDIDKERQDTGAVVVKAVIDDLALEFPLHVTVDP